MIFSKKITKTNLFLIIAIILGFALIFQILNILILAGIISYFLLPIVDKLEKIIKNRMLSVFIVLSASLTAIFGGIIYFFSYTIKNVSYNIINLQYVILQSLDKNLSMLYLESIKQPLTTFISNLFAQISTEITHLSLKGATLAGDSLIYGILFLFTLFYFLKDGHKINNSFKQLLRFEYYNRIEQVIKKGIKNVILLQTVYATLVVVLSLPLYLVLHLPFLPLIILSLFITSFIPKIGPSVVYLPISFYLLINNNLIGALIVLLHGLLILSIIDDYLRIRFAGAFELHPLLVFVGYVGGYMLFGMLGLIIGPILLMVARELLIIYDEEKEKKGIININL